MPLCNSFNRMVVLLLIVYRLYNSSYIFHCIHLTFFIYVTDLLNMCMKKFDVEKDNFDKKHIVLNLTIFQRLHLIKMVDSVISSS